MEDITMTNTELEATQEQEVEARPLEIIEAEIWLYKRQACGAMIEIGRRLIEAKAQLSHGEWLPWLKEKVDFSEASAQRFIRLAKEYSNPSPVTDLGASKALILLGLPASEREDFVSEKHMVNGTEKSVAEMSKRELEKVIKERDAALQRTAELESQMETQLEEQRTVYDVDMADARAKLEEAENRAKGYEMKLEKLNLQAAEDLKAAEETVRQLQQELQDLQNAPRDVAVETVTDQKAIDEAAQAARKETEEKLKAKIEKAEKAREKAEQAKGKAEQDLAALKVAQEEAAAIAEKEKQTMAEQVQTLQKKLAVASSSEMTIFKLHFEQGQNSINKMGACIQKMQEAGDADGAAKLKGALRALLNTTLETLQ